MAENKENPEPDAVVPEVELSQQSPTSRSPELLGDSGSAAHLILDRSPFQISGVALDSEFSLNLPLPHIQPIQLPVKPVDNWLTLECTTPETEQAQNAALDGPWDLKRMLHHSFEDVVPVQSQFLCNEMLYGIPTLKHGSSYEISVFVLGGAGWFDCSSSIPGDVSDVTRSNDEPE
jgi:hypothetical protein